MPTLEVQLAKAKKDLEVADNSSHRGLTERVRYLQQRLEARIERDELRAAAAALVKLAEEWIQTYEPIDLPTHTSGPTAPA
jgi:hypothetical protein